MKLKQKTILITGGSSGIGIELAKTLVKKGNTVLICGRSAQKLRDAQKLIPSLNILQCDISKNSDREDLRDWVAKHFPECSILVNNAAITHTNNFMEDDHALKKAYDEIQTNIVAPIALSKMLYPILSSNPTPAIINITSGLIYAPKARYPIYNATKAALHSFTQVLRVQLNAAQIKIIEVIMTVVDTPWHNGNTPTSAISPNKAASEMIRNIEKGKIEIRIDKVKLLFLISRLSPKLAFKIINK